MFSIFSPKKLTIRLKKLFLGNNIIWHAFYCKFATFSGSEKIQSFFKKPIVFIKTQNVVSFEKSGYFSRILRKICQNLFIKNFQGQKVSDQSQKSDIINWQIKAIKRQFWLFWEDDFPSLL